MLPVGLVGWTVLADLSGTAFGAAPTWTDITDAVDTPQTPLQISGGRQDWISDVSAATCSFTLDNHLGHFTPGNASSPHYPHVKTGVRIQVRAQIGGLTVYMFDGYVNSWNVTFENGQYAYCGVDASDLLGRWANDTCQSFLAEEMLSDGPIFLYSLQEPAGSLSFGDLTGDFPALQIVSSKYGPGVVDAGAAAPGQFAASLVTITNPGYGTGAMPASWLQADLPSATTAVPVGTLEVWCQTSAAAPAVLAQVAQAGGFLLWIDNAGLLWGQVTDTTGTDIVVTSVNPVCDGNVHLFAVTLGTDHKTLTLYVDGIPAAFPTVAGSPLTSLPVNPILVAAGTVFSPSPPVREFAEGGFAYLAYYGSCLSAGRIATHHQAGTVGFAGERTDQHLTRILSYRTNSGLGSFDTGLTRVGSQDIDGETFQQALFDCSEAEVGLVYINGLGEPEFRSRSRRFNPPVALTLDASLSQVDVSTEFKDDMQYVENDVTVTRPGGAAQRVTNPASISTVGVQSASYTLNIDTDQNALNTAQFLCAVGSQEQLSAPVVEIDLLTEPSTSVTLGALQLKPFDVIQIINAPTGAPSPSVLSYPMQGWNFSVAISEMRAQFYTTPNWPKVATWDSGASYPWDGVTSLWAF
jgi:hypothetical protein